MKRILLCLIESVNLINKQDGAPAQPAETFRVGHYGLNLLDPAENCAEWRNKFRARHASDQVCKRGLSHPQVGPKGSATEVRLAQSEGAGAFLDPKCGFVPHSLRVAVADACAPPAVSFASTVEKVKRGAGSKRLIAIGRAVFALHITRYRLRRRRLTIPRLTLEFATLLISAERHSRAHSSGLRTDD